MNSPAPHSSFEEQLRTWQQWVEAGLDRRLTAVPDDPLRRAMRYSTLGGGKRVRAALVYATGHTVGVPTDRLEPAACAVEMIHAYSLIHDDLPAMDDDDLRRGRPTCHRAFDEATAILAGDALQARAFQVLASDPALPTDPAVRLMLIAELADASGPDGMVGGQALDLAAEGQALSVDDVVRIHRLKTGALLRASVRLGALCQPALPTAQRHHLDEYAAALGLAFQIQDDLLDIEGDPTVTGKSSGMDVTLEKATFPRLAGVEAARKEVARLHHVARQALHSLPNGAPLLAALCEWLVARRA